jgi:hypothetical protein
LEVEALLVEGDEPIEVGRRNRGVVNANEHEVSCGLNWAAWRVR